MNITTADLQTELAAGSKELDILREVARFKGPGAVVAHLPISDTSIVWDLAEDGYLKLAVEPLGTFHGFEEDYGTVAHIAERGLEELVLHGRSR